MRAMILWLLLALVVVGLINPHGFLTLVQRLPAW